MGHGRDCQSGDADPETQAPKGPGPPASSGGVGPDLSGTESPFLAELVLFAVETGLRRSELAGMVWDQVNMKKKTITLPETKNGEKRIVPLSSEAVRILSAFPRRIDGKVWGGIGGTVYHTGVPAGCRPGPGELREGMRGEGDQAGSRLPRGSHFPRSPA